MNVQAILQWLPGIVFVAVVAFIALFFPKRSLVVRLLIACLAVVAALFLFGLFVGHQFAFWRPEDLPPLVIGFVIALLASETTRALLASRRRSGSQ